MIGAPHLSEEDQQLVRANLLMWFNWWAVTGCPWQQTHWFEVES